MPVAIAIDRARLAAFCHTHHIRKLVLFGSVLRPDFQSRSDIDVLVEFEQGHIPGFAFFAMQEELAGVLGRPVDLNTPPFLSPYFRDEVMAGAKILYVQQ